jgi:hypothetical protein
MATDDLDQYRVLKLRDWLKLASVSRSTGLKILDAVDADPPPPPKIYMSKRRFGIRLLDHQRWVERLAKKAVRP